MLTSIDAEDRWPYEVTFADQVQARDFGGAEVTRVLWRDTLSQYTATCGQNISRRQRIGAQTRVAKLDRIIGLDDDVLIDLRDKMLTALENGNAQAILGYSRAITEREKAIDSLNSAKYDAKLAEIEQLVASNASELKEARKHAKAAREQPPPATAPAQGGGKSNAAKAAETTANIAKTAKNVHETVKTAKTIGKMFGL